MSAPGSTEFPPTIFLRQVETYQLARRLNAADTKSATVLSGLIRALNTAVSEYLELAKRHRGGRTGQPFRNTVIRQLDRTYREITGKKPTSSPRGRSHTGASSSLTPWA